MNDSNNTDERDDKEDAHRLTSTDHKKKRHVLAHLAALQRELLEA